MKWHPLFHWFIRRLYYSRITVTGAQPVAAKGPLLILCLHRNGAVDGFVYHEAVPRLTYLVRAKLRKGIIGRLFFSGVDVVRSGDGGKRADQLGMIAASVDQLRSGEPLAIFPEGTSKLGPQHLPFHSGAAHIASKYLDSGEPLTVVPLGIHYECPWEFRSRVEIVVGEPIPLDLPAEATSRGARLKVIKQRFNESLESVGVNVPDAEYLNLAQKFAYIATLGTDRRYFESLKSLEEELPADAVSSWQQLKTKMRDRKVLRHQGVPLFPTRFPWLYALVTLLLAIPVFAGALINLPPLAIAYWAGKRFPDDTNVIALWRILIGVPVFLLWVAGWVVVSIAIGHGTAALIYLAITWLAVRCWYRQKKLAVATWNGLRHPGLRDEALALHRTILGQADE